MEVSVPLRGCGFEMQLDSFTAEMIRSSFRPLAGMWF